MWRGCCITDVSLRVYLGTTRAISIYRSCPRVGWTRGSGRVGLGHNFSGFWRVGSGRVSTSEFLVVLLIISGLLNQWESLNTAFGLMIFLRYLIYIIINQLINNYLIKLNIHIDSNQESDIALWSGRVGSDRVRLFFGSHGSGRVGSGRVRSGQSFAGSGRVQEKWPVDNSGLYRRLHRLWPTLSKKRTVAFGGANQSCTPWRHGQTKISCDHRKNKKTGFSSFCDIGIARHGML